MKKLLYVDGYNVIGAWPEAEQNRWTLAESRDRLIHRMQDYAGYTDQEIWLVFDGYKGDRPSSTIEKLANITVVYTKHGETADQYIERTCQSIPRYREARVATSDRVEQTLILGRGATRISSRELLNEMSRECNAGRGRHREAPSRAKNSFTEALNEEQFAMLESIRRANH